MKTEDISGASDDANEGQSEPGERPEPRVVIDEITGYPVVRARPGVPKITTEDVKRMLEDFP